MNPTQKKNEVGPARQGRPATALQREPRASHARKRRARKLFEAVAKPFVGSGAPVASLVPRRWRTWSVLALATLLAHGFPAAAQETRTPAQTNAATQTGQPGRLDYAAFNVIVTNNIFDPNRYQHPFGLHTPRTESFSLVGTLSYDQGTFAFFDGTSSAYRLVLKQNGAIAGFTVTQIAPESVELASGTNEVKLSVGEQMRREGQGAWQPAGEAGSYANSAAATTTSDTDSATPAAPSGEASDIIKRMMQRRQQEIPQ